MHQRTKSVLIVLVGLTVAAAARAEIPPEALRPVNTVAEDSETWDGSRVVTRLEIRKNGFAGTFHDSCTIFNVDRYHVQHIVRLPNKDGRAYFMVSQSANAGGSGNGYITVFRTDADAYDPATDRVVDTPATDGEYVYEERFNPRSKVGDWNHPGKMDVLGGIAVVAAQQLSNCNMDSGDAPDAVLFYDVRDPERPRYLGKIDQHQLGVDEVANLGLTTIGGQYLLDVSSELFRSDRISWDIKDWTRVAHGWTAGQHGQNFNSYERNGVDPGVERTMYFDSDSNSDGQVKFFSVQYLAGETPSWTVSEETDGVRLVNREYFGSSSLGGWSESTGGLHVNQHGRVLIYAAEVRDGHAAATCGHPGEDEAIYGCNYIWQNHMP